MKCKEARNSMQDLIDGLLDTDARLRVEAHVATCRGCESELEGFRMLEARLGQLALEPAPRGLADHIVSALKRAGKITEPVSVAERAPAGVFTWARVRWPLAAAALFLSALALFPTALTSLKSFVGRSAVLVTDTYVGVAEALGSAEILSRFADVVSRDVRTLLTVVKASISLLTAAGDVFMLPAVGLILLLSIAGVWYARFSHRRNAHNVPYVF